MTDALHTCELLPCPFCGGAAEIKRNGSARQSMIICCTDCSAIVESGDVFNMTAPERHQWNMRHGEAALQRELAAMKDERDAAMQVIANNDFCLSLNGRQLRAALAFCGGIYDDNNFSIQKFDACVDEHEGETMPAGLYIWCTEYPEEGRMYLAEDSEASPLPDQEHMLASLRRELAAANALLERYVPLIVEVMFAHRDQQSGEYNECDKPGEECLWCTEAAALLADIQARRGGKQEADDGK